MHLPRNGGGISLGGTRFEQGFAHLGGRDGFGDKGHRLVGGTRQLAEFRHFRDIGYGFGLGLFFEIGLQRRQIGNGFHIGIHLRRRFGLRQGLRVVSHRCFLSLKGSGHGRW